MGVLMFMTLKLKGVIGEKLIREEPDTGGKIHYFLQFEVPYSPSSYRSNFIRNEPRVVK